jgi:hypothetical protein
MFVLARLHAEVGSCLTYQTKLHDAIREYQTSLGYFEMIRKIEKSKNLSPEMKDFQTKVLNLLNQFSNDPRLRKDEINKSPSPPSSHPSQRSDRSASVEIKVDPVQGEGAYRGDDVANPTTQDIPNKRGRVFRRKKKN